jgi:hypothetical protein
VLVARVRQEMDALRGQHAAGAQRAPRSAQLLLPLPPCGPLACAPAAAPPGLHGSPRAAPLGGRLRPLALALAPPCRAVVAELQGKLSWYAENQQLVDQDRALVAEQAALIQRLERRLEAAGKAPGAAKVRGCLGGWQPRRRAALRCAVCVCVCACAAGWGSLGASCTSRAAACRCPSSSCAAPCPPTSPTCAAGRPARARAGAAG